MNTPAPKPVDRTDYIEYRPHAGWDLLIERPPGRRTTDPEAFGEPREVRYPDVVAHLYPTGILKILDAGGAETSVVSPSGWWALRFARQP